MGRGTLLTVLSLLALASGVGWKQYRRAQWDAAAERAHQRALQGNRILAPPARLPMDSPERLLTLSNCLPMRINLGTAGVSCNGEGELLGIPGYVDVERVDQQHLHSVAYSFDLPARMKLREGLSQLFRPAHSLDARYPDRGVCWALPDGQSIVMEWDDPPELSEAASASTAAPQVSILINSQVAAQLQRWLEALPGRCETGPLAPAFQP